MQKDHPFFEDLGKLASGATGAVMDMKREMESLVAAQTQKFLDKMNLVTREEFDVVKAMAEKARLENEALSKRIDDLEGKKPAAKPAKKKA